MLNRAEVGRRVRAHVRDLLEKLSVCDARRPECSEHGLGVSDFCEECSEITACLRRLASLPEPRGDALKMLISKAVSRAMAEAFGDAGIDSVSLASIWADGFDNGFQSARGDTVRFELDRSDEAVDAELERLGIDRIVTCEFPSVIGVANDAAAAGELVVKLAAIGASGVPLHGFEIKRNVIAVRSSRRLTTDEHKRISVACREYSIAVLGVPTQAPPGSYSHRSLMDPSRGTPSNV